MQNQLTRPETNAEREEKRQALLTLFSTCAGAEAAAATLSRYLRDVARIPARFVLTACEQIGREWSDDFKAPQPGHIVSRAGALMRHAMQNTDSKRRNQALAEMRRDRVTPEKAAEILDDEELRGVPIPLPPSLPDGYATEPTKLRGLIRAGLRKVAGIDPQREPRASKPGEFQSVGEILAEEFF